MCLVLVANLQILLQSHRDTFFIILNLGF